MPLFIDNSSLAENEEEPRSVFDLGENNRTYCGFAATRSDMKNATTSKEQPVTELFFKHGPDCKCPDISDEEKAGNLTIFLMDDEWLAFFRMAMEYTFIDMRTPSEVEVD